MTPHVTTESVPLLSILSVGIALLGAPLLPGIIVKTRAFILGYSGPSLFQSYRDIYTLIRTKTLYPENSTLVSRLVPPTVLTLLAMILCLLPTASGISAFFYFPGDFILVIALFSLVRFTLLSAAMDSGESLQMLSGSRWMSVSIFSEPTLFLSILTAVVLTRAVSLSGIPEGVEALTQNATAPILLIGISIFAVLLCENALSPFEIRENPHELTHLSKNIYMGFSGVEMGILTYAASLKLWIYCWLIALLSVPHVPSSYADFLLHLPFPFLFAGLIGCLSALRPLTRIKHLPRILFSALIIAVLALIFAVVSWVPLEG